MKKYGKIAILAGGISNEREISLKSGRAVYEALRRKNQDADFIDMKSDVGEELKRTRPDIAFLALHGRFGEDGTVQAALEKMGISYTGSGIEASRLALDKIASKEMFLKAGLRVPNYRVIRKGADAAEILQEFEVPFVIKPQSEGSSIGLSIVADKTHAKKALDLAFAYGEAVIVEEYIHGRELTVGILEEKALPVIEIMATHNVYDFKAKYLDNGTKYIVPAKLKESEAARAKKSALKAHNILGCRDFSRVDMRMDSRGNMHVLEVNTIPGLTEKSLLPKAASAIGMDFEDLCVKLIALADKRRRINGEK